MTIQMGCAGEVLLGGRDKAWSAGAVGCSSYASAGSAYRGALHLSCTRRRLPWSEMAAGGEGGIVFRVVVWGGG